MIRIENVSKSFGNKHVLRDVSLTIEEGSSTVIIGRSGTGKSVLLKLIVGLLQPDSGTIEIDGQRVDQMTERELYELRRKVGYVFQGAALFDSMNVEENVLISLVEHGERDRAKLRAEAERALTSVGLLPDPAVVGPGEFQLAYDVLTSKKPSELSGGMKKRVGVARALVGTPCWIFYDEPTTGLDPITSEQIDRLIRDLDTRNPDVTSVTITHDIFSVYEIADTVIMLDNGHIRFRGTPGEMQRSGDTVVQAFIERYASSAAAERAMREESNG